MSTEQAIEQLLMVERTLGLAMRSPAVMERLARAGVSASEFEHDAHAGMWRAMTSAFASSMRADAGSVEARMRDDGFTPSEARRWVRAAEDAARGSDVDDETLSGYIDAIRRAAAMRRLREVGMDLAAAAERDEDLAAAVSKATMSIDAIMAGVTSSRTRTAKDLATDFVARIERARTTPVIRAPLGIKPIDDACNGGPRLGSVLVFGADTGIGKTTFMRHMILSMLQAGRRIAVLTFESPAEAIFDGLVEMRAGCRVGDADRDARLWTQLAEATSWLSAQHLRIDDSEAITVEELSAKVHSYVREDDVDVVFIDYVQDIERSTRFARDDLNFAHISKSLRRLTQRYPLLVVENAQLSDGEKRTPAEVAAGPTERQLAFTKQWAKDASYILMGDRPKLSEDEQARDVTRLRLVKNRPEGRIERGWMKYDQRTTRLTDCDAHGRIDVKPAPSTRIDVDVEVDDDAEWDSLMEGIDRG